MYAFLIRIVQAVIGWLVPYMSRGAACMTAFVALMAALVAALFAAVNALIASMGAIPGVSSLSAWLHFLLPTNAQLCLSVLVSYKVLMTIFDFQKRAAKIAAIKC